MGIVGTTGPLEPPSDPPADPPAAPSNARPPTPSPNNKGVERPAPRPPIKASPASVTRRTSPFKTHVPRGNVKDCPEASVKVRDPSVLSMKLEAPSTTARLPSWANTLFVSAVAKIPDKKVPAKKRRRFDFFRSRSLTTEFAKDADEINICALDF